MEEKKRREIPMTFNQDDYFSTQKQRDEELIEKIDINLIDDFKKHPFKVQENLELEMLQESIKEKGIIHAVVVRKKSNGRFEMISGHRRKYACLRLGMEKIPCIIKNLSDDDATIFMVDSNLQREKILPSEKAFAYKLKQDAMSHQGKTSDQFGPKLTTQKIGEKHGDSSSKVKRYIRLTYLIPELLEMVDNYELGNTPKIGISPAVELSFLKKEEQQFLAEYINSELVTPNLSQTQEFKRLSQENLLSTSKLKEIMSKQKPNQIQRIGIEEEKLYEVIPKSLNKDDIEAFVIKACSFYTKFLKKRDMER